VRDHDVVATARRPKGGISPLDIADARAVDQALDSVRPDWVVNAAAYTAVDRAESEPEAAFAVNAAGPANLAAAAARTKARLLHVSTDFVFSGEKQDPYEETDPTGALGVYGKSKEEGEARVRALLPDRHLIVRVSWLFGPDGGNFVATMLRLAQERERLRVVADQRGTPTFTRDAADLLATLIEAGAIGTIHGANRGVTTWCDLAREALRLRGVGTPVDAITTADYPTPAARPRNSALRNRVLENTIGDSMRPWPDALAAYLREV
jgi:dTDP-4-dehydrorhamnose reductase